MTPGRWLALVACTLLVLPLLLGLVNVLIGTVGSDPHGYSLIFGFVFCVVFGSLFFALLPLVGPPERRGAWTRRSLLGLVVLVAGALLLLLVGS